MAEHDQNEHEHVPPVPKKPILKKIRTSRLNTPASAPTPRGGRPPRSSSHCRSRSSPSACFLSVRIFDDERFCRTPSSTINSAPVRMVRRLPVPPVPPVPASAAPVAGPSSFSSMPPPPPRLARSKSARALRPLPCPPPTSPPTPAPTSTSTPSLSTNTPTPRTRPVRPLPIPAPVLKVEPLVLSPARATASPSPVALALYPQPLSTLISPSPTRPTTISRQAAADFSESHVQRVDRTTREASVGLRGGNWTDAETLGLGGVKAEEDEKPKADFLEVQAQELHPENRISVVFLRPRRSLDSLRSDGTSEDDERDEHELIFGLKDVGLEDVVRTPRRVMQQQPRQRHREEEEVEEEGSDNPIDYTWMLSNRVLYRQDDIGRDPQFGSKWVRERKGRRETQLDYDDILRVLRGLH